jgi:lipopolysaccharide transport system permease protein
MEVIVWDRLILDPSDRIRIIMKSQSISHAESQEATEDWTLIVDSRRSIFVLNLNELWEYRDLLELFVRRDFVSRYKQTILGPAWHFIVPLMTSGVFTIVFGRIAKIPTDGAPPFLFFMAGNMLWTLFSAVLSGAASTFFSNAGMFSKVYFPRLVVPLSHLVSCLIAFGIQFAVFLIFFAWFVFAGADVRINAWALAVPVLVLMLTLFGLGIGLICAALTTKYRDLSVVVGFGLQLFMYVTPVIFPLSMVPKSYRLMALINPLAPIMETFRHAILGAGEIDLVMLGIATINIAFVLLAGILLFNATERTSIDTV